MTLLDGKTLNIKIKQELKEEDKMLEESRVEACLTIILVGNDPASQACINSKTEAREECDIKSLVHRLDESTTRNELLALTGTLNHNDNAHGVLVQLLSPKHISEDLILENIISSKGVDSFHPVNVGYLDLGLESRFLSHTSLGVMKLLRARDINLEGLGSVMVGASNIVGRPMVTMLLNAGCTISTCHIETKDLSVYI